MMHSVVGSTGDEIEFQLQTLCSSLLILLESFDSIVHKGFD